MLGVRARSPYTWSARSESTTIRITFGRSAPNARSGAPSAAAAAADAPAPMKPRRVVWCGAAVTAVRTLAVGSAVLERPSVGGAEVVEQLRERLLELLGPHLACPAPARAAARRARVPRRRAQRPSRATSGSSARDLLLDVGREGELGSPPGGLEHGGAARPVGLPLDPPFLLGHLEGSPADRLAEALSRELDQSSGGDFTSVRDTSTVRISSGFERRRPSPAHISLVRATTCRGRAVSDGFGRHRPERHRVGGDQQQRDRGGRAHQAVPAPCRARRGAWPGRRAR